MTELNKECFAIYLEETAAEIRVFNMDPAYVMDMTSSLISHAMDFQIEALEAARLRIIE